MPRCISPKPPPAMAWSPIKLSIPIPAWCRRSRRGASNAVANFAYGFDLIGNLTSRSDANESIHEVYCYDPLNRLTFSATGTSAGCAVDLLQHRHQYRR